MGPLSHLIHRLILRTSRKLPLMSRQKRRMGARCQDLMSSDLLRALSLTCVLINSENLNVALRCSSIVLAQLELSRAIFSKI